MYLEVDILYTVYSRQMTITFQLPPMMIARSSLPKTRLQLTMTTWTSQILQKLKMAKIGISKYVVGMWMA